MLRRQTMPSSNYHAVFQELTIYEDADTKLHDAHLTIPDAILEDDIKNSNSKFMK